MRTSPFLIVGSVIATSAVVVLAGREAWRALRRVAERRARARLVASGYAPSDPSPMPYGPPLWVAAAQLAILIICAPRAGNHDSDARFALLTLAALPMIIAAFALHGLPGHSRVAKYVLLWMGAFLVAFITLADTIRSTPGFYWTAAVFPISLALGTLLAHGWVERSRHETPGPLVFVLHRICMALGPASGLRAFATFWALRAAGVFPGFLVLRYFLRSVVVRRPILYLRSFHDHDARAFFGKVLAPSVGARSILVALIHEQQTGEELHRDTDHAWHGEIYALPEAAWRSWVERKLATCAGVVIDVSVVSPSLEWELAQALRVLPAERILVVSRTSVPAHITRSGVTSCAYSLRRTEDRRRAQRALSTWIDRLLVSITRVPDEPRRAVEDGGGGGLALALVGVVIVAGFAAVEALAMNGAFAAALTHRESAPDFARALAPFERAGNAADIVAALSFLAAWPLLRARFRRPVPADIAGVIAPLIVSACASIWLFDALMTGSAELLVHLVRALAHIVVVGYIATSCLLWRPISAPPLDLDRTVAWLLTPTLAELINQMLVLPVGVSLDRPGLLWLGGAVIAVAYASAAYALASLIATSVSSPAPR